MKKNNLTASSSLLTKLKRATIATKLLKTATFLLLMCLNIVPAMGQFKSVSGTITDASGEALPGVNIVIKGTTDGTVTNIDGNYTLEAEPTSVLVYSFIGFLNQEIEVGDRVEISTSLVADSQDVDEVVVVGYGVQKKSLVTGAISSIAAENMEYMTVGRVEEAMQGRTPGVFILPESGSPGAGMKVRIRGAGSNSDANPLYIVDGVRMSDINDISPDDIASVEVLKDAASSAIYGAEGGNGVIIISTKKGGTEKEGIVSYNFKYGVQSAGDLPELMNGKQYAEYHDEAGYIKETLATDQAGTNWLDEVFDTAPIQSHNLSFSGGSEKTNYYSSLSYFDQEGIIGKEKSSFNRISARLNVDHKIKKWMKVSTNLTYSHTERASLQEDDEYGGLISSTMLIDPLTPTAYEKGSEPEYITDLIASQGDLVLRDEAGRVYGISPYVQGEMVNPFIQMAIAEGSTKKDKIIGSIALEIDIMDGLKFTTRPSIDYSYENIHSWTPKYYYSVERNNTINGVNDNWNKYSRWQWENFATYNKSFSNGTLNVVLGTSAQETKERYLDSSSSPMPSSGDNFAEHDFTGTDNDKVTGNETTDRLLSYFGRASYDYKGKYMVQATMRRDLTSTANVPKDGIAGMFPSFSAGWNISEEDFFPKTALNWTKLRASWGQNGSIQAIKSIGQFKYTSTIVTEGLRYPNSDGGFITVSEPGVLPNPDLTWETSEQLDIGLDLKAWDSKLSFTFDYYVKKTKDLLLQGQYPSTAGNNFPIVNAGDVKNSGIELGLGFENRDNELKYGVNFNLATLKNEVTGLNSPTARINGANIGTGSWVGATAFEVGKPIWYFRGYKTNGIDGATGDPIFVDTNEDGLITDEDRTNLGDPHPDIMYGGSLFAEYKGFDFNVLLQGQAGNQIVYGFMRTDRLTSNRMIEFYDNRWTPENTNASMPSAKPNVNTWASDLMVKDGDFLRIKQIQLGYTIPRTILEKIKLTKARLYVSLDDYFTFTKYDGMDPMAGSSNDNSLGIDRGVYPTPRKVMFGMSVSF